MPGHKNHKLKDSQLFALCGFLKQREKALKAEMPSREIVRQQAVDALKFEITDSNLRRAIIASGVEWKPRVVSSNTAESIARHEKILRALAAKLGEDIDALAAT